MSYQPYRKPASRRAHEPYLSPAEVTTCTHDLDTENSQNKSLLLALADQSGRLLGKLSMPEAVHLVLPVDYSRIPISDGEIFVASDEDLHITATKLGVDKYAFDARVSTQRDLIDTATYTVWRPKHEGFIMPWGISLESSSRTIYPQQRGYRISEASSVAMPTVSVSVIRTVLHSIVVDSDKYSYELRDPDLSIVDTSLGEKTY